MSSEIEVESIPGLPHDLPAGERIVWQGSPAWKVLARHTFKVRWLAAYFSVFALSRAVTSARQGEDALTRVRSLLMVAVLAATCLAVLSALAWLNAKSAIYTITTRRVVLRIGVALPTTWNLPFARIASADVQVRSDGDGDVVLQLKAPDRIAWLQLWPHTQPWHLTKARPALRGIPDAARVASLLADAVQAWAVASAAPITVEAGERGASPRAIVSAGADADMGRGVTLNRGIATEGVR
jgi:hypothetical protein